MLQYQVQFTWYILLLHLCGFCVVAVSLCVGARGQRMIDGGLSQLRARRQHHWFILTFVCKARVSISTQCATLTVSSLFQMGNDSLALMVVWSSAEPSHCLSSTMTPSSPGCFYWFTCKVSSTCLTSHLIQSIGLASSVCLFTWRFCFPAMSTWDECACTHKGVMKWFCVFLKNWWHSQI